MATTVLGHRALPGRVSTWQSPLTEETTRLLTDRLIDKIGSFDAIAGYHRMQPGRTGLALLLLNGSEAVGFLKLRDGVSDSLSREHQALLRIESLEPDTFSAPEVIDFGSIQSWQFLLTTALPLLRHRVPRNAPVRNVVSEIETILSDIPRPPGARDSWRPMHGDLTPWNLRRLKDGRLVLLDWEDATWGPAGADEVLYHATDAAVRGRTCVPSSATEAIGYWRTLFTERPDRTERDSRLTDKVLQALSEMEAS